jgi:hypothetical protein
MTLEKRMTRVQDCNYLGGVNEITIITPIKPGRTPEGIMTYQQRLEAVLKSIRDREMQGIPTPIRLILTIHFARWIIWQDKLIFTSNFDGSMWQYLRDFANLIADDLDRVWENCIGYPQQGSADFDAFWDYVCKHQVSTTAFYADNFMESVQRRRALLRFKSNFDAFLQQWHAVDKIKQNREFRAAFDEFVLQNQSYLHHI